MDTISLTGMTRHQLGVSVGTCIPNFNKLECDFQNICNFPFYNDDRGLEFAKKILFTLGPICQDLPAATYKQWRIKFHNVIDQKQVEKEVHVSNDPSYYTPFTNNVLRLTLLQAELLAVKIFTRFNDSYIDHIFITPKASNIFPENILPGLARALGEGLYAVANIINSSCQEGGEQLPESKACVAALAALDEPSDDARRAELMLKVIICYADQGKNFDKQKFQMYAAYATDCVKSEAECVLKQNWFQGNIF